VFTARASRSIEVIVRAGRRASDLHHEMEITLATGTVQQLDAASRLAYEDAAVLSTDPPYYDNISYADLSDFSYVWLRPMLRSIYPNEFSTLLVPKEAELVATPYRYIEEKKR
jgi:putative DNA methylase